jgi:hypothetical protein
METRLHSQELQLVFTLGGGPVGTRVQCAEVRLEDAAMRSAEGELIAVYSDHRWERAGRKYPRVYCARCGTLEAEGVRSRAARSLTLSGASMFVDGRLFAIYNPELNRWVLSPRRGLSRSIVLRARDS